MPNRLAETKSLYLQKHAENPINWWYWGEEALLTAKKENKPIFLSIGYSSCHWCTVMEGEAFSDQAIAAYLNANFLPIKVDREERPDLDSIYMQALQMMTGQGGWPLNIFLTPEDLVPFYGGTYFPVEPRYGRPGFLELLQSINDFYHQKKDKLQAFKQEMLEGLRSTTILPLASPDSLTQELLQKGIENNTKVLSRNDFGSPRFPMIPYSNITLQGSRRQSESSNSAKDLAKQRGKDLANGGIYDHVGGGFHRYTVDSTWSVPHFEKMLYDNGLIVEYLANLWSAGITEPEFKLACEGTVKWLQREMTAPEGYFYAAQDADSFATKQDEEPEEGAFYLWHYSELESILSAEELAEFEREFTVSSNGNFEGKNVLQRREGGGILATIKQALDKLFTVRYGKSEANIDRFPPAQNNEQAKTIEWQGRIPPVTDTKMIVAWNSLMISGLARAYGVFGDDNYLNLATNAAKFILENQWQNGRFHRLNYHGEVLVLAQSEDYALVIKALLDLASNSPQDSQWLEKATEIQEEFNQYFWSVEMGGYYNNATNNSNDLLIRERSYIDNATPSANGVAIANLVRLALLTENLEYLEQGRQALQAFSSAMQKSPVACPSLFTALDWYLKGTAVRSKKEPLKELISLYLPTTVLKIEEDLPNQAVGIVCQGLSCLEPAKNKQQLLEQMGLVISN
jgi:uncharacterized protein YyaL (SSP411 family)